MAATNSKSLIPWIFVGGMVFVVAVNAGMVTMALKTFPGLAHDAAFERGLAYNRVLAEVDRQERLGWTLRTAFAPAAPHDGNLRVQLNDRDGQALSGAKLLVTFVRPVGGETPVQVELSEEASGSYVAPVRLPSSGQWDARVSVTRSGERFESTQRLFIR